MSSVFVAELRATSPPTGAGPDPTTASPGPGSAGPGAAPSGDRADRNADGSALGLQSTNQASGAVRSPIVLMAGLALVVAGLVVLVVRNRHRFGSSGTAHPADEGHLE